MKLSKEDMEKIAEEMNRAFSHPFLPEGFFTAEVIKGNEGFEISFSIGRRDAQFDENFVCISSGTFIG